MVTTLRARGAASALLAATALVGTLAATSAPASASGSSHTVTVRVGSTVTGWTAALSCTPAGGGATFNRQATARPALNLVTLTVYQYATFSGVPNATCNVTATSTIPVSGTAAQSGVVVTKDLTVALTPGTSQTQTVPTTTTSTTPVATSPGSTPLTAPMAAPVVSGEASVGHVLVASPAAAPVGATVTGYQWYVKRVVSGHARSSRTVLVRIKGAHHKRLRLKERLAGKHVLVGVTYSVPGASAATAYSHAVKVHGRLKEGW